MATRWRVFTNHRTTTLAVKVKVDGDKHIPIRIVSNVRGGSQSDWRRLEWEVKLPKLTGALTASLEGIWHSYTIPVGATMPGVALLGGIRLDEDVTLRVLPQYSKHPWFKVVGR